MGTPALTIGMCGYSNCFRNAVGRRGFIKVCAVHKADPRKWPESRYSGSVWVSKEDSSEQPRDNGVPE